MQDMSLVQITRVKCINDSYRLEKDRRAREIRTSILSLHQSAEKRFKALSVLASLSHEYANGE